MGRADRRHQTERVKARFYRKQRLNPLGSTSKSAAGLYANHGCNCSCPMCGNPRRHFGERTMQEIKAGWPGGARRVLEREYT